MHKFDRTGLTNCKHSRRLHTSRTLRWRQVVKHTLSSGDGRSHTALPLGDPGKGADRGKGSPPPPATTSTSEWNPPGPARPAAPQAGAAIALLPTSGLEAGMAGARGGSRDW